MTSQITKTEVEALIDKLAKNRISDFVCGGIYNYGCEAVKGDQCPILIGDVLEKMKPFIDEQGDPQVSVKASSTNMMRRWNKCGIDKSLQGIVEGSGWEECVDRGKCSPDCPSTAHKEEVLKSPEARALLEFLLNKSGV